MITTEFESDRDVVVILDEECITQDLRVIFAEEGVYLSQYDDDDREDLIFITHSMFKDFLSALDLPEGVYISER